jgi:ABC-type transport system substrate-binding protein
MSRSLFATAAALAAGIVLLSAACGSTGSTSGSSAAGGSSTELPAHQQGGTVTVALSGNIDYLDPALAYYQSSWQIEYSTCVKLTNYRDAEGDEGRVIYPEAASSLPEISADGLTYTYAVPPGKFMFNTGEPVTAQSFQHALERDLDPKQQSYFGAVFLSPFIQGAKQFKGKPGEHVSGIEVVGDQLVIKLVQKDGGLISKLTTPFACAVTKDMPIDSKGVHAPAGAGPYYVDSYTPNRSIVLKRNPHYTGDRPAYPDEIDYTQLTIDQSQATLETKQGQLDYIYDAVVPAQNFQLNEEFGPDGTSGGPQRFFITPGAIITYLGLNTTRPAFSNEKVRQAVNWAINRKEITIPAGYGAELPTDKYLPPQFPAAGYEKSVYPLDSSNVEKAKQLIAESGVPTPIHAVLYTCNTQPCPDRAVVIQQQLKAVGIDVSIKQFDRGVQFTKEGTKGEPYDIADEGWIADYYDAYDFLNVLLDGSTIPETGGSNFAYFDDPAFNKRMEAANQLTGDERDRTYGQIATDLATGPAPWAPRAVATTPAFFSGRIGCQVNQSSYGFALNTFCIRS